jgi:predicted DNA-binding transcriptional regulator AlpA
MTVQVLRPAQVAEVLQISASTLWRRVRAGDLKPIKLGTGNARATGFLREDVANYIETLRRGGRS